MEGFHLDTNLTVIFENTFLNWSTANLALFDATKLYDRNKLAIVLHSVPELSVIDIEFTLRQVLAVGHSIWLTGTNNYTLLDAYFPLFIERLAALSS